MNLKRAPWNHLTVSGNARFSILAGSLPDCLAQASKTRYACFIAHAFSTRMRQLTVNLSQLGQALMSVYSTTPHNGNTSSHPELRTVLPAPVAPSTIKVSLSQHFRDKTPLAMPGIALKHFKKRNVTLPELIQHISLGFAWSPIAWRGGERKSDNYDGASLLVFDFDTAGIDTVLNTAPGKTCLFAYETASSTPDNPRCRAVWQVARPIDTADEYSAAMKAMGAILQASGLSPDTACFDTARFFYGSTGCRVWTNTDITIIPVPEPLPEPIPDLKNTPPVGNYVPSPDTAIADRRLAGAIRHATAAIASAGAGVRNNTLFRRALFIFDFAPNQAQVAPELIRAALAAGLPEREAAATVASAANPKYRRAIPEPRHDGIHVKTHKTAPCPVYAEIKAVPENDECGDNPNRLPDSYLFALARLFSPTFARLLRVIPAAHWHDAPAELIQRIGQGRWTVSKQAVYRAASMIQRAVSFCPPYTDSTGGLDDTALETLRAVIAYQERALLYQQNFPVTDTATAELLPDMFTGIDESTRHLIPVMLPALPDESSQARRENMLAELQRRQSFLDDESITAIDVTPDMLASESAYHDAIRRERLAKHDGQTLSLARISALIGVPDKSQCARKARQCGIIRHENKFEERVHDAAQAVSIASERKAYLICYRAKNSVGDTTMITGSNAPGIPHWIQRQVTAGYSVWAEYQAASRIELGALPEKPAVIDTVVDTSDRSEQCDESPALPALPALPDEPNIGYSPVWLMHQIRLRLRRVENGYATMNGEIIPHDFMDSPESIIAYLMLPDRESVA